MQSARMIGVVTGLFVVFVLSPLTWGQANPLSNAKRPTLRAGVAKVDITHREALPIHDPLYAKALVIEDGTTTAVIVTVDAVAIAEIGPIKNEYFAKVREGLERDLKIAPTQILINASHCHGTVCADVAEKTIQAVKEAKAKMVPVFAGSGRGEEKRVSENRRLKLKSGNEADVRHAYALPPDEEVVGVGPIDPEIGILRLSKTNGETLAVVYNFACHPIQGVPGGKNTADMIGFASKVIEDNLSEGALALFLQGCGGDINPVMYKDVEHPRHAESQGTLLGLSTLKGLRSVSNSETQELKMIQRTLELPRRMDNAQRIEALLAEQDRLLKSLSGTSLNLKTFLPLVVKYNLSEEFPSYYSHRYLHDKAMGRDDFPQMDAENRRNLAAYIQSIHTMEQLSRNQVNLALLKKHQATNDQAGSRTLPVELVGLRVGDFVLTSFPGELTVQIGLNLKKASPHKNTFVAGYSNGYIYYAPTTEQMLAGQAQEDCDCLLAPEWQPIYEKEALKLLGEL
ncbi:MAG: hypothetical protein U0894_19005 [Pirellulales bacterium]